MRIATYNVNGINARLPRLLEWLDETKPDVACLQEIKCVDDVFPRKEVLAAGYHALVHGQKGFNGVAVLTREPAVELQRGLTGDPDDVQSRFLLADCGGVRVASIYLPNGNPQPGPKFDYKLMWFARLERLAASLLADEVPTALTGDFNVIPTDYDVARPEVMADDALMQPESRAAWRRLLAQGWLDALRARLPGEPVYTFWDYQAGCWQRNYGLRIDHLLLSPALADTLRDAGVDKTHRGRERASDHAPTWVEVG